MVNLLKNKLFWSFILFFVITALSVLSKWFIFLDFGIFNYSILLFLSLLLPNLKEVFNQIDNSHIESIKLPFCELRLVKNYDYFLGIRPEEEYEGDLDEVLYNDLVVLAFFKGVSGESEAYKSFESESTPEERNGLKDVVKQVHYKIG